MARTKSVYRSGFEKGIAINLTKRNIKFEYETLKLKYYIKPYGKKAKCNECGSKEILIEHIYTPDFIIGDLIIEAKGLLDSKMRTKMTAVKLANPELDIRFLFMYDNYCTKLKKQRYSDWCDKNGFPYAFMVIPIDWLGR